MFFPRRNTLRLFTEHKMILQFNHFTRRTPPQLKIDIETLVDQKMPPSPGSLMRLSELLRDYNASKQRIVETIRYEPVLVARILRLANSVFYSLEREVILIDEALDAIGNQAVYDIVLIEFAARTFHQRGNRSEAEKRIWEHSLAVALIAREISQTLEMRGREEAFICGLLHDFGKFLLLNHDPAGYAELLEVEDEAEMLRTEIRRYGYTHPEVGSLVARRWNLPEEVCYSILYHHRPSESEQPRIIEHIIDVADLVANVRGYAVRPVRPAQIGDSESAMKLGLSEPLLENVWSRIEEKIAEVIKIYD